MRKCFLMLALWLFWPHELKASFAVEDVSPEKILLELSLQIKEVNIFYHKKIAQQQFLLDQLMRDLIFNSDDQKKVDLLITKTLIEQQIQELESQNKAEIAKVRYLKGLQIIKILYEKVLSLDHHFASIITFNEINKMVNPNQYPEFGKLKELVSSKREKKSGFELSSLLGTNMVASIVQTFSNLLVSSLSRSEREAELAKVDCILDFSLRMQNDLNTIYFETAFLQNNNQKIKRDIEILFRDYTKSIGYTSTLEICRSIDDWENLTQKMEDYLKKMKSTNGNAQFKMQVNIDFPIDRLLQFIAQYNNFIDQGGKFYEKFNVILNSYENEKTCETKLPLEYKKLKADVNLAIEKFNVAYKPVEINGSKMKEILYGINEFD
ncbi:hypothetical protein KIH23_02220 [Flavobacterium sp. CYK-55]|uniref:hypothetical protein n=1 Tax=Flavobacterium sp. CYK-55 TaxID=2835529 RepID=UPI001BCD7926|nr:hypothetical protein [Flavobacterium sp. CYK-55]MBS7786099.1 hypothetical protein [Flavobacterium sp. CYK-55]